MGWQGDTDDDDVAAKIRVCKQKGLADFEVNGQLRMVRALATDPFTEREFHLMLVGASGSEDFSFVESIDGYPTGQDGKYVDLYEWWGGAPGGNLSNFLDLVRAEMDDEFWDAALAAFLDVYNTINNAIVTAVSYAEMHQGEHLTEMCKGINAEESDAGRDDPESAFQVFTEACGRRAPFAEFITVDFPKPSDLFPEMGWGLQEHLPRVGFGYEPGQEAFVATGSPYYDDLFLNGIWTTSAGLERALENLQDPWDRHGARAAAADLKAIQSGAMGFIRAEYIKAKRGLDNKRNLLAFEVFGGYESAEELKNFDTGLNDQLREALSPSVKRVEDFLATCCARRP